MNLVASVKKRIHKVRSLINDPANLSLSEKKLKQASQLHPDKAYLESRCEEVMAYYRISRDQLDEAMARAQAIHEHHDHDHGHDDLDIVPEFAEDKNLFDYYRQNDLNAAVGHLCFDIPYYRNAFKLLQYLNSYYPRARRRQISVLDYGCGSADYSIAFASQGYHARIADLEGGPIGFASWRLTQRQYPHDAIAVSETNLHPDLGKNAIVLAPEVLEHIRDPLKLVQNMERSLPSGGFFWTSGFPVVTREVGGDHLPEAAALRLDTLNYLETHFKRVTRVSLPGFLFRKP